MTPDDLVELEAIKRLKARYLRLLDLKEWDELETLFGRIKHTGYERVYEEMQPRSADIRLRRGRSQSNQ